MLSSAFPLAKAALSPAAAPWAAVLLLAASLLPSCEARGPPNINIVFAPPPPEPPDPGVNDTWLFDVNRTVNLKCKPETIEGCWEAFKKKYFEPRHAIALAVLGRGTKRHKLLKEIAETDNVLQDSLVFAARFEKGPTSLTMHRFGWDEEVYTGKWTKTEISKWLKETSYPPVNFIKGGFPQNKYFLHNPYSLLFVVRPPSPEPAQQLVDELEMLATKYWDKLKITFFSRTPIGTPFCDSLGVWTNDEMLLLTKPFETPKYGDHGRPGAPKYRLEGVTPGAPTQFLEDYFAGSLSRYYKPGGPWQPPAFKNGLRNLTSWDFIDVTQDPEKNVLVAFVSSEDCQACNEFQHTLEALQRRLADKQKSKEDSDRMFDNVVLGFIDQAKNEHTQEIAGLPSIRFWPSGKKDKDPRGLVSLREDDIWDFIEEELREPTDRAEL